MFKTSCTFLNEFSKLFLLSSGHSSLYILDTNPLLCKCFLPCSGLLLLLFSHSVLWDSLRSHGLYVACWASLSFTVSWSLLKFMSIELVMSSNHLILWYPFSSCLQSFPTSESFPVSWLFASVTKVLELQLQRQSVQ